MFETHIRQTTEKLAAWVDAIMAIIDTGPLASYRYNIKTR